MESSIFQQLLAEPLVVTVIISIPFALFIYWWYSDALRRCNDPDSARFVAITPNALATLGVLGTFTGICVGLFGFDVENIDDSVPRLLEGLQAAFTTSIFGIFFSIRFRYKLARTPREDTTAQTTPDDILTILKEIRDGGHDLRKAISSEGDSSLLTQMQKMRTEMVDGQKDLVKEFREFKDAMVKNNQDALIEALNEIVKEFNVNLIEQFGESFRQLNVAVHKMVEWQENYRKQMKELEDRITMAAMAIEASQQALEKIERHAQAIPDAISLLEPALKAVNAQAADLAAHIEVVAALRDKALEAFPIIENNIEKLTSTFAGAVEDAASQSKQMTAYLAEAVEETANHSRQVLADSKQAQAEFLQEFSDMRDGFANEVRQSLESAQGLREGFADEIKKVIERIADDMAVALDDHRNQMEKTARETHETIADAWKKSATDTQRIIETAWKESEQKLNAQFENFDQQMQRELTRAMQTLGRQLASLSEKFVEDYMPLTEKLSELVRLIEQIKRDNDRERPY